MVIKKNQTGKIKQRKHKSLAESCRQSCKKRNNKEKHRSEKKISFYEKKRVRLYLSIVQLDRIQVCGTCDGGSSPPRETI